LPPISLRPWPVAPRPFDEEAFGSWFGRIASRYQLSVIQAWEINQLGTFPPLTNADWILFTPVPESTLKILATLARLDVDRLTRIQTPSDWMVDRPNLPYWEWIEVGGVRSKAVSFWHVTLVGGEDGSPMDGIRAAARRP
jgi:hypothetical protein